MSWWLMGGYALYVWGAYGLVWVTLALLWWWSRQRLRRQFKRK